MRSLMIWSRPPAKPPDPPPAPPPAEVPPAPAPAVPEHPHAERRLVDFAEAGEPGFGPKPVHRNTNGLTSPRIPSARSATSLRTPQCVSPGNRGDLLNAPNPYQQLATDSVILAKGDEHTGIGIGGVNSHHVMSERRRSVAGAYTINRVCPTPCTRIPTPLPLNGRPSTFDPTKTQWEALTKEKFNGVRCCFGQLVWYRLKSAGNMAPGLFMGWRIDPGMRYRRVLKVMDYQSFRTNGNVTVHDVPEPELFVEEGDPVSRSQPLPIEPCEQAMARCLSMQSGMFLSFLKAFLPPQLCQALSHEVCTSPLNGL